MEETEANLDQSNPVRNLRLDVATQRELLVSLSHVKESVAPSDLDRSPEALLLDNYYPFATVLRFRVLQIVCGISFLIVGTVAFIEERGELNLSLGIPAGGTTILAAAASIHTTKGFNGYRTSTGSPNSPLRFLGPSARVAVPIAILWGSACSFVTALVIQSVRTLAGTHKYETYDDFVLANSTDITILACVELSLCVVVLFSVTFLLKIDCKFDSEWSIASADIQSTAMGVGVMGAVGVFTIQPTTSPSERVSKVAWEVED